MVKPIIYLLLVVGWVLTFSGPSYSQEKKIQQRLPETHNLKLPKLIPYRKGEVWGFADSTGVIKVPPKYRLVAFFDKGLAKVYSANGVGLIDESGKEVLKPEYQSINVLKEGLFQVENQEGKNGVVNRKGEEIIPVVYDYMMLMHTPDKPESLIQVNIDQKLHPSQVTSRRDQTKTLRGLYSISGQRILPVEFTQINPKGAGVIEACKEEKCQYLNTSGQVIIPLKTHHLYNFMDGVTALCEEDGCQYVNAKGEVVISKKFKFGYSFSQGLAGVADKNKKWGFIDLKGKWVIPPQYDVVLPFYQGVAIVRKDNKTGIIDRQGNELTEFENTEVRFNPTEEPGRFTLRKGEKIQYGYIDSVAKKFVAIENPPQAPRQLQEGLAITYRGNKYGFVDANGKEVIPLVYNQVTPFYQGLAVVSKDGFWGIIDKQHQVVLPFIFRDIQVLGPDLFKVRTTFGSTALWGLINREGLEIAPVKYTFIGKFINGIAPFGLNNSYGMLNLKGEEVVKPIPIPAGYTSCESFMNGLLKVCNYTARKEGYVDYKGRVYFQD